MKKKTKFSAKHQQLAYKDIYLNEEELISAYQISNGAELCVIRKTKDIVKLNFSSLNDNDKQKVKCYNVGKSKGLNISPGLNLVGQCTNANCNATLKHEVWAPKGFGYFDLGREIRTTKCPCCGKELTKVTTCGFSFCQYHIEGERVDSGVFKKDGTHDDINGYETFLAGSDEKNDKYYYLSITVKKLPK